MPASTRTKVHPAASQEVGWFDEDRNSSGVLASKLSSDALAVKGQFGDTMGLLTQVGGVLQRMAREDSGDTSMCVIVARHRKGQLTGAMCSPVDPSSPFRTWSPLAAVL